MGLDTDILQNDVMLNCRTGIGYDDVQLDIAKRLNISCKAISQEGKWYQENPFYTQPMYPSLPYLLSTYGPPAQAYINFDVGIAEMGLGSDLYFLVLDYTKDGWIAMYEMELARKDGIFVGCPVKASSTLWLWSPEDAETAKEYGFADGTALKNIEEATSMTLEEFYQKYKDPANTQCLESPVDIYQQPK